MSDELYKSIHSRRSINDIEINNKIFIKLDINELKREFNIIKDRNPQYYKTLVNKIIKSIENTEDECGEIIEYLYDEYIQLLSVSNKIDPSKKDIVRYYFENMYIDIEETPNIISGQGTTGLRTWEAAKYLCIYLNKNSDIIENKKRIVELGAGTGLVSLYIKKKFDSLDKEYLITDGDDKVVMQLERNFDINGIKDRCKFQRLLWNQDSMMNECDIILAADVTYDKSILKDLCYCIKYNLKEDGICLISCTIRNIDTINEFENTCNKMGIDISIISDSQEDIVLYEELINVMNGKPLIGPIRIYKLSII